MLTLGSGGAAVQSLLRLRIRSNSTKNNKRLLRTNCCCSGGLKRIQSVEEHHKLLQLSRLNPPPGNINNIYSNKNGNNNDNNNNEIEKGSDVVSTVSSSVDGGEGDDKEDGNHICCIQVPRQRHISISKSELLDAILLMFDSQPHKDQFILLSTCLDSIIHAEHKGILEDMRLDLSRSHCEEKNGVSNGPSCCLRREVATDIYKSDSAVGNMVDIGAKTERKDSNIGTDVPSTQFLSPALRGHLSSSPKDINKYCANDSRVAVPTRFQHAFVQLLCNAQFGELSARDLMLTSALNSDYLLTLPIYVDWKRASESHAIIFRRGYATERQKGLLIVEKLDYLQSKILQQVFLLVGKPLQKLSTWITKAFKSASEGQDPQNWTESLKQWLKELPIALEPYSERTSDNFLGVDQLLERDPILWMAAKKAINRYEGILSPIGPRGRLLRMLLMWIGIIPSMSKKPFDLESDDTTSEPYLRPIFLSRMTLADIWEPASWRRCGNNAWKMLKTATSILFSQSVLQEPAFQELILLFTEEGAAKDTEDTTEFCPLQLKIYRRIPIPDLPVIFPHKKLSFRILDTVRLDIATILGLLAFFINYKFEDILSSPSALGLDVIAISALIIYVTRVALGYKQTWDRYQLLVNKTLYEKTLASGFGSIHFLLDASEQQQYKEAILTYAVLLNAKTKEGTCPQKVKDKCERFLYAMFKEKVDMPIDKAIKTLMRLGLVTEKELDQQVRLQVIPCSRAYNILKQRWNSLLSCSLR